MQPGCSHLNQIRSVTPRTPEGCEECLKIGSDWVHLRLCLECGHVGCCDQSPHKHATKHFHRTRHPIMRSFEPGETWGWCYVDKIQLDNLDALIWRQGTPATP
jgi:uncharacterized UBP type Zn finger protein